MPTLVHEEEIDFDLPDASGAAAISRPAIELPSRAQIIAVLAGLATAVGHRIALILAIIGAFSLAIYINQQPSIYGVASLVAFCALVVWPVVNLSSKRPA